MAVARVTEIKSGSKKGFDDAMKAGLTRARKTLKNVRSAWIKDQEIVLDDNGRIKEYRVSMMVTFVLTD